MPSDIEVIGEGSVTSPKGYLASGTYAGLKIQAEDALDLGILLSETTATVGATFTTNSVVSPSVTLSRTRVANGFARGVVVNSGCANCCVGEQGYTDAQEMTSLAALCWSGVRGNVSVQHRFDWGGIAYGSYKKEYRQYQSR